MAIQFEKQVNGSYCIQDFTILCLALVEVIKDIQKKEWTVAVEELTALIYGVEKANYTCRLATK